MKNVWVTASSVLDRQVCTDRGAKVVTPKCKSASEPASPWDRESPASSEVWGPGAWAGFLLSNKNCEP